jgi:hypothetical protein
MLKSNMRAAGFPAALILYKHIGSSLLHKLNQFGWNRVGDETMEAILITGGIMLCSLLCVFASLRNRGEVLENTVPMLLCQFYIMVASLLYLAVLADGVMTRTLGMVALVLGAAPIVLKKSSFQGARYCIALGATLIACAMML